MVMVGIRVRLPLLLRILWVLNGTYHDSLVFSVTGAL